MLLAATGGEDPPNFIATNSRWAWTGQDGLVRLKYYDATARRYAEAFTLAAMERFDDTSVSSWKLGEYFSGSTNLPADWDRDSYISGYETYLRNVEAGAPRDARNDRVTIYQTNPITKAGLLEQSDFSGMMIGLADSDPQFFEEPAALTALRENLHGVVPMSTGLDVGQFTRRYQTTYPEGFPNPWGYSGATRIDTPQAAWYYGHCGPLPMDQEFISTPTIPTEGYTGAGSTTSRLATMDQLGPGGMDHSGDCSPSTDDWGGVPFGG
jgi:hypothetical protein